MHPNSCPADFHHNWNTANQSGIKLKLPLNEDFNLPPQMPRKYSAPGQLCSTGGHIPATINPTAGRKGSIGVSNQQFGYTCPTYNMPQWNQVGPLSSTAAPAGLQQGFLIPAGAHQTGNNCGSSNLRTTQASWDSWRRVKLCLMGLRLSGLVLKVDTLYLTVYKKRLSGPSM